MKNALFYMFLTTQNALFYKFQGYQNALFYIFQGIPDALFYMFRVQTVLYVKKLKKLSHSSSPQLIVSGRESTYFL